MNANRSARWIFRIATAAAGLGVALGAFGAHGLEAALPQWYPDPVVAENRLAQWQTAVQYQLVHALGAMVLAGLASFASEPRKGPIIAATLLLVGAAIFSGCLYVLVLTGQTWLGAVVPIGGVLQLAGWLTATLSSLPASRSHA